MSQGINDAGWFIVSELPDCLILSKAKDPVRCVILSKAKDLSALTQEHEHHKFPNDFIFLSKAKDPT